MYNMLWIYIIHELEGISFVFGQSLNLNNEKEKKNVLRHC